MDELKRIALELVNELEHETGDEEKVADYRRRIEDAYGRSRAVDEAAKRGYNDAIKGKQ